MPLQSQPSELKLSQVATEFGSDGSTQLTDYNRGGGQVPESPITVGISGTDAGLKLSQFYAKSSVFFSSWNIVGDTTIGEASNTGTLKFRVGGPGSTFTTHELDVEVNLTKANDTGSNITFSIFGGVNGTDKSLVDVTIPDGQSSGTAVFPLVINEEAEQGVQKGNVKGDYGTSQNILFDLYACKYKFDVEYQIAELEYKFTGSFNYRQRYYRGYLYTGSFKAAKRDCTKYKCDEFETETVTTWTELSADESFGTKTFSSTRTQSQVFAAFNASDYYNDADCRSSNVSRAGDCTEGLNDAGDASIYNARSKYRGTEQECTTKTRPVSSPGKQHPAFGTTCFDASDSDVQAYCNTYGGCTSCTYTTTETYEDCDTVYKYEILYNIASASSEQVDTDECKTFSTTECETFGAWEYLNGPNTLFTNAGWTQDDAQGVPNKFYISKAEAIEGEGFKAFDTTDCKGTSPSDAANCIAGLQTFAQDPNYPESQIGVYEVKVTQGAKVYTDWTGTLSATIDQSTEYYLNEDDWYTNHEDGAYSGFNTENCKSSEQTSDCEGNGYPEIRTVDPVTGTFVGSLQQEFWNVQANRVDSTAQNSTSTDVKTLTSGDGGDGGSVEYITHVEGLPLLRAAMAKEGYVTNSAKLTAAVADPNGNNDDDCPAIGETE